MYYCGVDVPQNVSPPELRGSAFAIFNLTDDIGNVNIYALVVYISLCYLPLSLFHIPTAVP